MARLFAHRYFSSEPSKEEVLTNFAESQVADALRRGDFEGAREAVLSWANSVARHVGLSCESTMNWKFFKREVIARWFGGVERRKFPPEWNPGEALEYACSLLDRNIRISQFPSTIACHAVSIRIGVGCFDDLEATVVSLDPSIPIEIFPESSSDRTICFRRFAPLFNEMVVYEAGLGQAMLVFESEQGLHPIVSAVKTEMGVKFDSIDRSDVEIEIIRHRLERLIKEREEILACQSYGLCRTLGIEAIAVEGYYDDTTSRLVIVDGDLPFDLAFMQKKSA